VLNGDSIDLMVGQHTVTVFPGLNGVTGNDMHRFDVVDVQSGTAALEFEWKTAPLSVEIVDQLELIRSYRKYRTYTTCPQVGPYNSTAVIPYCDLQIIYRGL